MKHTYQYPEPEDYLKHRAEEKTDFEKFMADQEWDDFSFEDFVEEVLMKLYEKELRQFFEYPSVEDLEIMSASHS